MKLELLASGLGGLCWQIEDRASLRYQVGDTLPPRVAEHFGIAAGKLKTRHIAFLVLVALDEKGQLGASATEQEREPQRARFAEILGMTVPGLRRWLANNLAEASGVVLRWDRYLYGRQPSRTGGPWRLHIDMVDVLPHMNGALGFVENLRQSTLTRRSNPDELQQNALLLLDRGEWDEAFLKIGEALAMFRTRKWCRELQLYFEIFLKYAEVEMQLGTPGLQSNTSTNLVRSVKIQRLQGPRARIILGRTHHIAALIKNQGAVEKEEVMEELRLAKDELVGLRSRRAIEELWKVCSYEETTMAKSQGVAAPRHRSAILEAGQVVEGTVAEAQMRYGESLLQAGRPAEALKYLEPALYSGRLTTPAWVIAERLEAKARWGAGKNTESTLEVLDQLEEKVRSLGFAHQVREVRYEKRLIHQRIRSKSRRKTKQ